MALAKGVELVGGDEELFPLRELLGFGIRELAGEGFVRCLQVGTLGSFLCEVGVEARGIGGASRLDIRYLVLNDLEAVILRCCSASTAKESTLAAKKDVNPTVY